MSASVLSRTFHFIFGLDCRPIFSRDSPARRCPPRVRQRRKERTWISAVLFLSRTAVATTMVLPLAAGVTEAASGFSNWSLNGTYAFRTSGDSLFTSPDEVTSTPVFLAAVGLFQFDGLGRLTGSVAANATRSRSTPSGKYGRRCVQQSDPLQREDGRDVHRRSFRNWNDDDQFHAGTRIFYMRRKHRTLRHRVGLR